MIDDLTKLFIRFNYNNEKGFILNLPSLKKNEHLTCGFDNKRKEVNIHFTNENINELGAKRREFIFVMSSFRFFLFVNRFKSIFIQNFFNLTLSSKTNFGKLKKHKFIINSLALSEEAEDKLVHKKKNGKYWKLKNNFDSNLVMENFKYIEKTDLNSDNVLVVYKFNKSHLSIQGFVFKLDDLKGLYFIPIKKFNRFAKFITITIYNYLNAYPEENTLPIRQLMYERLKHIYLNNQE